MSVALAVGLAVASSVAWAALDATRKSLTDTLTPSALVASMTFGQGVLFLAWAWAQGPLQADWPGYAAPGALCLALNVAANLLFVEAVRSSPLSLSVPFLALSPVFAALAAIPMLGELPALWQWLGVGSVVGGALALNGGDGRGPRELARAFLRERGSVLMSAVAALWALTVALDKRALGHAPPAVHGFVQTAGVCLITVLSLAARGRARELRAARQALGRLGASVLLGALGLGLQLLAITVLYVGAVETLKRALGLVFAVLLGRAWFGEPITPHKLAAILAMAAGTALVILGGR